MSDQPARVAGRVGPHRESHEPRLLATNFVSAPTGFTDWDGTHGITDWGMEGNDQWGDCGFAALDHYNDAKLGDPAGAGSFGFPTFQTLLDAYWAYGIAQGEPGPHPDQGVENNVMLGWAYKLGLIDGYAEVPFDQLDWFASQFKGVLVGIRINGQLAIEDFQNHVPWDAMPDGYDGHDTLGIITKSDGSGSVVTWGGLQRYTPAFRSTNFTDAWVILDKDDTFVDWVALQAALDEVHGTHDNVEPVPDPPTPQAPETAPESSETPSEPSNDAQVAQNGVDHQAVAAHSVFLQNLEHRLRTLLGRVLSRATEDALTRELDVLLKDVIEKRL